MEALEFRRGLLPYESGVAKDRSILFEVFRLCRGVCGEDILKTCVKEW
jgi:hypothetical protein